MKKPITPKVHGIMDYVIGAVQIGAPILLKLPKQARNIYQGVGIGSTGINMATDTPAGVKNYLSFKDHQKADLSLVTGMSLLTLTNFVRNDKKTLYFHLGLLGAIALQYILTDYNSSSSAIATT